MRQTSFPFSLGIPLGAVMALLGAGLVQEPQTQAAPPPALQVGVVDFVRVFENFPSFTKDLQDLEELFGQHQRTLDQQKAKLDELKVRIDGLDPNTFKSRELELQYKSMSSQLQGLASLYKDDLQRREIRARVVGYEQIEKAIREVAAEKGMDLVLRLHPETGEDPEPLRLRSYEQRNVWHADEKLDLTPAVIRFLKVSPSGQGDEK